jgi:hypothetical protein
MKYFKPNSLTWWASMVPLLLGVLAAAEPLHGMSGLGDTISNMTGGASPYVLINAGLIGIGVRAAL